MSEDTRRVLTIWNSSPKLLTIALGVYVLLVVFSPDFVLGAFESHAIEFRLSDLFLLGLIGYLIYSVFTKDRVLFYPSIFFPALGYVIIFFLGAVVSFVKTGSSLGLQSTFFAVKYFEYFLIFFVTVNLVRTEEQVNLLLKWLIWLLTAAAGLLIITRFIGSLHLILTIKLPAFTPEFHHLLNPRTTLPFASGYGPSAEFLYLVIPFSLFFLVNLNRVWKKLVYSIGLAILGFGFFLVGARGPMAALFVVLVLLAPLLERRLIPWLLGGGIGVVSLYFAVPFFAKRINSILVIFSKGICSNNSMCVRVTEIWPKGLDQFLANPIFGGGLASFPTSDTQYIRLLADQGVIGLGGFVFFAGSLLFYLVKFKRESAVKWKSGVFSAMIIATVALLINGITATAFEPVRAMEPFWFLLGLVFAFEKFENSDKAELSAGG